jgi:phosphoribosylformylglycinamidine synthase
MKFAVIRFPGANCDQDAYHAVKDVLKQPVEYVWHEDSSLKGIDCVILPGGFSYGDYLRTGAIARFSPIMDAVLGHAERGRFVLGICNGFQVLCEAHLLPGALVRNAGTRFVCRQVRLCVENASTPWTNATVKGQVLQIPVAHGEGAYTADEATLHELNESGRVLFRYCDEDGRTTPESNPNGSMQNIAGIASKNLNVLGMMPHPERACEKILGSADGKLILDSVSRAVLV